MSTPHDTLTHIKELIEGSIKNQPRSLQRMIGPSEIGNPCLHCLAAKLAGWEKTEPDVPWLPFIGTCVHEHYERLFAKFNIDSVEAGWGETFLVEQRVTVGELDGQPITGSTDLYVMPGYAGLDSGMTVDWKIVGKSTLDKVRRAGHPGSRYVIQAHLYAKGWNAAGYPTKYVSVYFQPRNSLTLNDGYMWTAEYDQSIADKALERLTSLYTNLRALDAVPVEIRDAWISGLERDPSCFDCKKYPDYFKTVADTPLTAALN